MDWFNLWYIFSVSYCFNFNQKVVGKISQEEVYAKETHYDPIYLSFVLRVYHWYLIHMRSIGYSMVLKLSILALWFHIYSLLMTVWFSFKQQLRNAFKLSGVCSRMKKLLGRISIMTNRHWVLVQTLMWTLLTILKGYFQFLLFKAMIYIWVCLLFHYGVRGFNLVVFAT